MPPFSAAEQLVRVASREVGTKEEPRNSNRGERVEEYQSATWLSGTGWPWCAAFVCWCLRRVEKIRGSELPFDLPTTPRAFEFEEWGEQQGLSVIYDPKAKDLQRGDIVTFDFSHIGIIAGEVKPKTARTIEGNTDQSGSREGGGVYRATRDIKLFRARIRLP